MQELLHNAGLALEALLTPTSLLQLAAIAIAILVAWVVRPAGAQYRARQAGAGTNRLSGAPDRSADDHRSAPGGAGVDRSVRRRTCMR